MQSQLSVSKTLLFVVFNSVFVAHGAIRITECLSRIVVPLICEVLIEALGCGLAHGKHAVAALPLELH